jgi:hypothetical protein
MVPHTEVACVQQAVIVREALIMSLTAPVIIKWQDGSNQVITKDLWRFVERNN